MGSIRDDDRQGCGHLCAQPREQAVSGVSSRAGGVVRSEKFDSFALIKVTAEMQRAPGIRDTSVAKLGTRGHTLQYFVLECCRPQSRPFR